MKKKFYGIILARLNSKGIKKKNLKKIKGKNLIEICLKNIKKSQLLDKKVFLCSEAREILRFADKYKCVSINRPRQLSKDNTHVFEILNYLFIKKKIIKQEKGFKNFIVLLSPTSPFRSATDIDNAIKKLTKSNCRSLISVTENNNCIFKSIYLNSQKIKPVFKLNFINKNRQEFKKTFRPNGSIFIFDLDLYLKKNKIISSDCSYIINDHKYSVDIDNISDLKYAQYLAK